MSGKFHRRRHQSSVHNSRDVSSGAHKPLKFSVCGNVRFWRMLWKKSSMVTGLGMNRSLAIRSKSGSFGVWRLGAASCWVREPCKSSEVLNCCGEEELVVGTGRTSETKPIKTKLSLEVCEQHLDLLATAA